VVAAPAHVDPADAVPPRPRDRLVERERGDRVAEQVVAVDQATALPSECTLGRPSTAMTPLPIAPT
jgi:hypothetical protein